MRNCLALESITKVYESAHRPVHVLNDISVSFEQGMSYALCGVSGSGKSTLLAILAGFESPTSGRLLWNARSRADWNAEESSAFCYYGIGMLFQRPYLMRELTVFENVTIKGWGRASDYSIVADRAKELLERVGLGMMHDRYPYELSGGEQIRVALVRALALPPQFLIADEPTAHLDYETAQCITDMIFQEAERAKSGIIIATHDPTVSNRCVNRYTLQSGTLISS